MTLNKMDAIRNVSYIHSFSFLIEIFSKACKRLNALEPILVKTLSWRELLKIIWFSKKLKALKPTLGKI